MQLSISKNSYEPIYEPETHQRKSIGKLNKISLILVFASIFLLYRILFALPQRKACVTDQIHELTFTINRWIYHNIAKVYLAIGQLVMDIWLVVMIIFWIALPKNFRYPGSMFLFFSFRTLFLRTITMPFTSYVVWQSPGFYSLGVPYDHTSDYFFSGHTGTLIIIFCEIIQVKAKSWIKIICFISIVFMASMLLIVRVHYTIDIFAAIFIGLFIHSFVKHHLIVVDQVASFPFKIVTFTIQKVKQLCQSNQNDLTNEKEQQRSV